MPTASAIRFQVESTLARKIPSALTPQVKMIRPVLETGIERVDELLHGGLPVGAVSELTGPECSGRTSLAFIARITEANKVCAWIDVSNMFDPASAAAVGVNLEKLLWVRCGVQQTVAARASRHFLLPEKYFNPRPIKKGLHGGGFGPHPRTEVRGLSDAVGDLFAPRCAEPQHRPRPHQESAEPNSTAITQEVRSPSRAQMASLPRNHPEKFYDVVVQVAIIRPGPIVGKMMHPYMRRRQKKEEVSYPHPSLESTLKRTLGVPLFQEQLLRMAMVVANFSGAEAEELRRAVGMRRSWERMKNLEGRLRAGMTSNGLDTATQDIIIENISSFALYGFPESHAASFALITYASAYFKVKYLAAFMGVELGRGIAVDWPGGIVLKLRRDESSSGFRRMIAANTGLGIPLQFIKRCIDRRTVGLTHSVISTYQCRQRYRFWSGEGRIPSGTVFHGSDGLALGAFILLD